jgi:hypothetical protein
MQWREIQAQGFTGTRKQVARCVQQRRTEPARTGPKRHKQAMSAAAGENLHARCLDYVTALGAEDDRRSADLNLRRLYVLHLLHLRLGRELDGEPAAVLSLHADRVPSDLLDGPRDGELQLHLRAARLQRCAALRRAAKHPCLPDQYLAGRQNLPVLRANSRQGIAYLNLRRLNVYRHLQCRIGAELDGHASTPVENSRRERFSSKSSVRKMNVVQCQPWLSEVAANR